MKEIVISAPNLLEGGPLNILNSLLSFLNNFVADHLDYRVTAIVYDKTLCSYENIQYIEIKWAKKSWFNRIYCEYFYFNKISKKMNVNLWLSLHDISPTVRADIRAVYCHNPSPFNKASVNSMKFNYKEYLFSLFYKYLYQINIDMNNYVIVQQDWIRTEFCRLFNLNSNRVIVAYPNKGEQAKRVIEKHSSNICSFIYPAFPRTFKNFEVVCNACEILYNKGVHDYEVVLTIDGSENSYSKYIYDKYKYIKEIKFLGILLHQNIIELYEKVDCLIFPSKLETWGLPISEFSVYDKPMIIADLPYSHETAAKSKFVKFFDPNDPEELCEAMLAVKGKNISLFVEVPPLDIAQPVVESWERLINLILKNK